MVANWHARAELRVNETPELRQHREAIMYDWPGDDEHWQWVATAPVADIVAWAESLEAGAE